MSVLRVLHEKDLVLNCVCLFVVMFILVCSMAAFNFSIAHKNVTHSCLKRFISRFVATNLLATYVI